MGEPMHRVGFLLGFLGLGVACIAYIMGAFTESKFAVKTFPYGVSTVDGAHSYPLDYNLAGQSGTINASAVTKNTKYYGHKGIVMENSTTVSFDATAWTQIYGIVAGYITLQYTTAQCAGAGASLDVCASAQGLIFLNTSFTAITAGLANPSTAAASKVQGCTLIKSVSDADTTGTFDDLISPYRVVTCDGAGELTMQIDIAEKYITHKADEAGGKCDEMTMPLTLIMGLAFLLVLVFTLAMFQLSEQDNDMFAPQVTAMIGMGAGTVAIGGLLYFYLTCGSVPVPEYVKPVQSSVWGLGIWSTGGIAICTILWSVWFHSNQRKSSTIRPY